MKIDLKNYILPGFLLAGIVLSAGCFGPFKKKSGGSSGGTSG
jgi:hypothetical protein